MLSSVFGKRRVQKKHALPDEGRPLEDRFRLDPAASPRSYTPQVELQLSRDTDWFPKELLRSALDSRTPPQRNASLYRAEGASTLTNTTVVDSRTDTPDASFHSSTDDIIIIETAPSLGVSRELPPLPPGSSAYSDALVITETNHTPSVSRKPTPTPIKIPDNLTGSKIRIQYSASAGASAGPSMHLPVPVSNGPSRASSPVSDDLSSAISGTTLARALVASSFILTNDSRGSRCRSGITRQDSATLPRGEHPLHGRFAGRGGAHDRSPDPAMHSPIPPVPALPSSAELSARSQDGASAGASATGNDGGSGSGSKSRRSSFSLGLESRRASAELRQSRSWRGSVSELPKEQGVVFSPISPIAEAPSPAPSAPNTPTHLDDGPAVSVASTTELGRGRASSLRRGVIADDVNLAAAASSSSSSSLRSRDHRRFSTEPGPGLNGVPVDREAIVRASSMLSAQESILSPGSDTVTTASVYSAASFDRANSVSTPGTSVSSARSRSISSPVSRSHSDSGPHGYRSPIGAGPNRAIQLLPIGERPHSVQVPQSPLSARMSSESDPLAPVPGSARISSGETPVDSPDLLDIMFPVAAAPPHLARVRSGSGRGRDRGAGHLTPLAIVPGEPELPTPVLSSGVDSLAMASGVHQTFPETPYAFSPLFSAGYASPIPPPPPPPMRGSLRVLPLPRTMTISRPGAGAGDAKLRWGQRVPLSRSVTGPSGARAPPTPPSSVESVYGSLSGRSEHVMSAGTEGSLRAAPAPALASIQEAMNTPSDSPSPEPLRRRRSVSRMRQAQAEALEQRLSQEAPVASTAPDAREESAPRTSLQSRRRNPSPLADDVGPGDSPPPAYFSMQDASSSATLPVVHLQAEPARQSDANPSPISIQSSATPSSRRSSVAKDAQSLNITPLPSPPPSAFPSFAASAPSSPMPSIEEHSATIEQTPPPPYVEEVQRAAMATDAPPPSPHTFAVPGPSRTATPDLHVPKRSLRLRPPLPIGPRKPSVTARSRTGSVSSTVSGPSSLRRPSMPILSASTPRFQATPVKFRGLTKEAVEWTFSSQQLQELVSTAIRQTADPSAIRLLPLDILNEALPEEIDRLETTSAELRTSYKLNVRRRKMLLAALSSLTDGSDVCDPAAATRIVEELSEVGDCLDQITEDLYDATMQLNQLTHLRDVHSSSALIMALHKLNRSLKKHLEDGQKLREQVATLEAERNDAWRQAQEIAQDFDDLAERTDHGTPSLKEGSSRRSSRVILARKNSSRAARAGLRSSLHRRSERSSVSSGHQSGVSPSSAVRSAQIPDIPPVPPMPPRSILGITTDLPTSRTETPSSGMRAMTEAQKELCDMLGISLDDLKSEQPIRRQSFSGALGAKSPTSPYMWRRKSDTRAGPQRTPTSARTPFA